jgi:hypothetical protein
MILFLGILLKNPNTRGPKDLFQGQSADLSVVIPAIKGHSNRFPNCSSRGDLKMVSQSQRKL